jgi:putative N6-adenine-specific DNA methylase
MFEYQKQNRYFAQVAGGLEKNGIEELTGLGASQLKAAYRGIYFNADQKILYKINYMSRLITRVLAPLHVFKCDNTKHLYKVAKSLQWQEMLKPSGTFAVFATVSHSKITHSKYAALCLKDAVADFFREKYGRRPNVDTQNPGVWINLYIENNRAAISLDTSGGSLHRRGYRKRSVDAPLQETLAAAIIRFSGWEGEKPFYDPMCGSGTIVSEALMHYCRIPPGYLRKRFGFEFLPDFNRNLWKSVKREVDKNIRPLPKGLVSASDLSRQAVEIARENNKTLPGSDRIRWKVTDFQNITDLENHTIITNPPFGIRLGKKNEISMLFKEFGNFLKKRCKGSTAYVYIGDRDQIKKVGLKPSIRKPMVNGAIDGRLCKFEIY